MKQSLYIVGLVLLTLKITGQNDTSAVWMIRHLYDVALTDGQCYKWLHFLTKKVGNRISGSPSSMAAITFTQQMLDTIGLDKVWQQPCMVPHWSRGEKEIVKIVSSKMGEVMLPALALGGSGSTPDGGVVAEVVELKSLEEAHKLGKVGLEGKIAFFNRPMDVTQLNTFSAYGGAVDQRGSGPNVAVKYGAVATLVRSMTTGLDDIPHTGGTHFEDGIMPAPALGISTNAAELLSKLLKQGKVSVYVRTTCRFLSEKPSFNVIGEIKGSEKPNEVIVIGGHLDSWDVGEGAHDDGAGCMQSMDVLNVLKKAGYKPKRTIRCVLFMNEENGLRGGKAYYEYAKNNAAEIQIAAIESDAGGFTPRGLTFEGMDDVANQWLKKLSPYSNLLEPYGIYLSKGGGGADIGPLRPLKTVLIGLRPDSQRYFDVHHTHHDTFETVNKKELELGTATMASLVYLLDRN